MTSFNGTFQDSIETADNSDAHDCSETCKYQRPATTCRGRPYPAVATAGPMSTLGARLLVLFLFLSYSRLTDTLLTSGSIVFTISIAALLISILTGGLQRAVIGADRVLAVRLLILGGPRPSRSAFGAAAVSRCCENCG